MIWSVVDCRHGWRLYLQFLVYGYGVLGSRISTALLALALLLQARGQCQLNKYRSDQRYAGKDRLKALPKFSLFRYVDTYSHYPSSLS